MKPLLFLLVLLASCAASFGNTNWTCVSSKKGVTIIASCNWPDEEWGGPKMYDAFLDRLVQKLDRWDKDLEILLLIDRHGIFRQEGKDWFATMAYDTLRETDINFIEAYNFYRMDSDAYRYTVLQRSEGKPFPNKYRIDLPEPIDLNSTFSMEPGRIGLKIRYDYGYSDSATYFDRLYTLVQYGIDHLEEIRQEQQRMIMPYGLNDIRISFLTIDTGKIKTIPLQPIDFNKESFEQLLRNRMYTLVGVLAIFILASIVYLKKRSTHHILPSEP